jgi:hypothetical protein
VESLVPLCDVTVAVSCCVEGVLDEQPAGGAEIAVMEAVKVELGTAGLIWLYVYGTEPAQATKSGVLLRLMSYVAVLTKLRKKASAPARFLCSVVAEMEVTNAPRTAVTVTPITTKAMRISTSVSPASGRD